MSQRACVLEHDLPVVATAAVSDFQQKQQELMKKLAQEAADTQVSEHSGLIAGLEAVVGDAPITRAQQAELAQRKKRKACGGCKKAPSFRRSKTALQRLKTKGLTKAPAKTSGKRKGKGKVGGSKKVSAKAGKGLAKKQVPAKPKAKAKAKGKAAKPKAGGRPRRATDSSPETLQARISELDASLAAMSVDGYQIRAGERFGSVPDGAFKNELKQCILRSPSPPCLLHRKMRGKSCV